jgi:hypothetical protein
MKACVQSCGEVQFDAKAFTNVLPLKNVRNKFHVACDSEGEGAFVMHEPNGTNVHFVMHADGLHSHDADNCQLTMMVSSVK